jgi:hypothetical protein
MKFIETSNACIVGTLSITSWTNPWTRAIQWTPFAFPVVRAFISELRSKYFLAVPLETVKTELCSVFWHAFIFKATFYHAFCHNSCGIIKNSGNIVLEVSTALSSFLDKNSFTLT